MGMAWNGPHVRCAARSGSGCGVVTLHLPLQQNPQISHRDLCLCYHAHVGRVYVVGGHEPLGKEVGVEGGSAWAALQVGPDWGPP
jgi:hypothetical protein